MADTTVSSTTGAVDCVLLDVDGTLIDSTYLHAMAWQRAFAQEGVTALWWRSHRAIGMGGALLVAEVCGQDVEDRLGDRLRARWAQEYRRLLPEVKAFPRAAELVRDLASAGYKVALASSGAAEFTQAALRVLDLNQGDFAAVTSADDADQPKPAPDLLRTAVDRAGGTSAVLVGDSVWDAQSARRMAIPFVGVRTGGIDDAELVSSGASRVVNSVTELQDEPWRP